MTFFWIVVHGFMIWAIPLFISFFFYSSERELVTSFALFKSVMVVVLTLTTLAINVFRPVKSMPAVIVAVIYTVASIVLDLLVVIPMTGLSLGEYIEEIPMIYVVIFALTWGMLREPTRSDSNN